MLATETTASGIAGQSSVDATAWFTLPMGFLANFAPKGFERALVARSATDNDAPAAPAAGVVAAHGSLRSATSHSGAGDAPYEHR